MISLPYLRLSQFISFDGIKLKPTFMSCLHIQLVLTVGLLAVVVYLYTVVAFNFFRKFYNKSEDEDEPDMKCDDMMTVSKTSNLILKSYMDHLAQYHIKCFHC